MDVRIEFIVKNCPRVSNLRIAGFCPKNLSILTYGSSKIKKKSFLFFSLSDASKKNTFSIFSKSASLSTTSTPPNRPSESGPTTFSTGKTMKQLIMKKPMGSWPPLFPRSQTKFLMAVERRRQSSRRNR